MGRERERKNRERKQKGGGSKRQHKTEKRARDRLMDEFEREAVMFFFFMDCQTVDKLQNLRAGGLPPLIVLLAGEPLSHAAPVTA